MCTFQVQETPRLCFLCFSHRVFLPVPLFMLQLSSFLHLFKVFRFEIKIWWIWLISLTDYFFFAVVFGIIEKLSEKFGEFSFIPPCPLAPSDTHTHAVSLLLPFISVGQLSPQWCMVISWSLQCTLEFTTCSLLYILPNI